MKRWRQLLHIEPPDGWLNDPNGLCYFNGKYHVFFQYSPKSALGETTRRWGHYEGESLLNARFVGTAIEPDTPDDKDGVYSGSALVHGGRLHVFYTGNVKEDGDHDYIRSGRGANVIHVISEDGISFGKKAVVLRNSDYPDFCSCHVRDPKVWADGGGFKMVLGARTLSDEGCVLVYRSDDLERWEYVTAISVPDFGYMWECPDYFEVGGRGFLSLSPQGLPSYETRFQNLFQAGWFAVDGRLTVNRLTGFREWDMGFDFYAPQSFKAPDGRRLLIGWLGIGDDAYRNLTVDLGWQHCLTLPREVTLSESGTLLQNPIHELDALFGEEAALPLGEAVAASLPFDLRARVEGGFTITLDGKLSLRYDEEHGIFSLTFSDKRYGGGRTVRKAEIPRCTDIRVIADMSSLEIYLSGGAVVMSTRFYPDIDSVALRADGRLTPQIRSFTDRKDSI